MSTLSTNDRPERVNKFETLRRKNQ